MTLKNGPTAITEVTYICNDCQYLSEEALAYPNHLLRKYHCMHPRMVGRANPQGYFITLLNTEKTLEVRTPKWCPVVLSGAK